MSLELSEQELLRRQATEKMRELGIEPYPAALYEVNAKTNEILEEFPKDNTLFQEVSIAGRIMSRRIMGAASFVVIQDSWGKIQLYVKRDEICPDEDKTMYNTVFKKLLDIGDIIGVKGYVFITQMGEISIHVKELTELSKSAKPLPIVKEKDGVVVKDRIPRTKDICDQGVLCKLIDGKYYMPFSALFILDGEDNRFSSEMNFTYKNKIIITHNSSQRQYIKNADNISLQQSARHLCKAFQNFFEHLKIL
mgnify:CR=1 FL=1